MYSAKTSRGERGGFSYKDVSGLAVCLTVIVPDACTRIYITRHSAKKMPGAPRHFC
ncbi:Uncharacterized protein APZ42_034105 [Daphnia magna]|uniref:Uncharacterized protein n=1 Tax=Daphnia magna TaxID=35525 RepID=A0A164KG64_9CRUS|nr:Uncharacterized protein APZ42_034105 [Daphnia magna]